MYQVRYLLPGRVAGGRNFLLVFDLRYEYAIRYLVRAYCKGYVRPRRGIDAIRPMMTSSAMTKRGRRVDGRRVSAFLWLALGPVELGESQPSTTVTPGPPPSLVVQAPSPPAAMNAADRAVLLAIKAMNPDAVGALPNWDPEEEPCTSPWEGVACDVDGNLRSLCAKYFLFSLLFSVTPSLLAVAHAAIRDSGTCSAVASRGCRLASVSSRSSHISG